VSHLHIRYFQVKADSEALSPLFAICDSDAIGRRMAEALSEWGIPLRRVFTDPAEVEEGLLSDSTIIAFVCNIDQPHEMAALRRLRREVRRPALIVIAPPSTGTGVRRALDAGADAVVFEPEIEATLAPTVVAVASGQSVVPRKLRASVERPAFSHRERQVLALVSRGLTNGEIAEHLLLAQSTVKSHLSSAFNKLGIRSRKEVTGLLLDPEQARSVGLVGLNGAAVAGPPNGAELDQDSLLQPIA
jgi:DNA-binding NarL/FixJ family response regulator